MRSQISVAVRLANSPSPALHADSRNGSTKEDQLREWSGEERGSADCAFIESYIARRVRVMSFPCSAVAMPQKAGAACDGSRWPEVTSSFLRVSKSWNQ